MFQTSGVILSLQPFLKVPNQCIFYVFLNAFFLLILKLKEREGGKEREREPFSETHKNQNLLFKYYYNVIVLQQFELFFNIVIKLIVTDYFIPFSFFLFLAYICFLQFSVLFSPSDVKYWLCHCPQRKPTGIQEK